MLGDKRHGRNSLCSLAATWALVLLLAPGFCFSIEGDTLSQGQSLRFGESQAMISEDGTFQLGFFKPGASIRTYLGIQYRDFPQVTTVWVANREKPLSNRSTDIKLEISQDGNLVLLEMSEIVWSTNLMSPIPYPVEAVILDTGNFVLRDSSRPSIIYWQSFDHPTDTWLPGAKLGFNRRTGETYRLISWKSLEDPSPGMFSFQIDLDGGSGYNLMWNMSTKFWSSGTWNGAIFHLAPELSYSSSFLYTSNDNESYFTYSLFNSALLSRLVMDSSGELKQFTCQRGYNQWTNVVTQPRNPSEVYGFCGEFSILNGNTSTVCRCLPGYNPYSVEGARLNCIRRRPLQCENYSSQNGEDGFLIFQNLSLPSNSRIYPAQSLSGCQSACLQSCSCSAFAYTDRICSTWNGPLLNIQQLPDENIDQQRLYLKLAASEIPSRDSGKRMKLEIIIPAVASAAYLVLGCFFGYRYSWKKIKSRESGKDLLTFDFNSSSTNTDDDKNNLNNRMGGGKDAYELPIFTFASVSAATDNFSPINKLGEGGFGPVHKGKAMGGQEIAVKRLSRRSNQGLEEFRNELTLIAKLQHRNLVRLLGCCIEQEEKILIYEYMPNKSLDYFLFDPNRKGMLDWGLRIKIIEGIAQGLFYLHEHSRLRVIHRDLKASNILLDKKLHPKISDFGMARIFGGDSSQANTRRVVGTYGYMAPEYAIEGLFSVKSDVFSFGILILEILSSKKNTGFYNTDSLNLLGHAWELWISDRAMDLIDSCLDHPPTSTVLRYINIGLLCVEEDSNDRPTMASVVSMLSSELSILPKPKNPAFCISRNTVSNSSGNNATDSANSLTISIIEPR